VTEDVFIDARRARWNASSGTGVYANRLVAHLPGAGLSVRVLDDSRLVDLRGTRPSLGSRLLRWPRKLASDLVEVPLASVGARLTHLLYPEAAARRPFVVTVHDLDVVERGMGHAFSARYYGWRTRAAVRSAERVICVSGETASAVARVLGRTDGVRVVHQGIDWPSEPISPERGGGPTFLYSGGFATRKNVAALFVAWQLFRRESEGTLLVTGRPPAQGGLLPDGVRPLGVVSRERLWRLTAGATAVVYPSVREGFGFPVLEGALLGRPVVCGRVGIVPELPPGLVLDVDVTDPEAIAAGLRDAASGWTPDAAAVRRAREHFTWSRCADETVAVYREVL